MKVKDIIKYRLDSQNYKSDQQIVNGAKEIIQELALLGLSRNDFFNKAAFHGGTAFRILYGLNRFSEDLDFCLKKTDRKFKFSKLIKPLSDELLAWGLSAEIIDKSKLNTAVQKVFLKENSLGAQLILESPIQKSQKFTVKIELDTNPPAEAKFENKLCHFPTDFYVVAHDLPTMFAGKLHALICRPFEKGRDWYDFVEYLRLGVSVNEIFLKNALKQIAPEEIQPIPKTLSIDLISDLLINKLGSISLKELVRDSNPFIEDKAQLDMWSESYFKEKINFFRKNIRFS